MEGRVPTGGSLAPRVGPTRWEPPPGGPEGEAGDLRVLDWPGYEAPALWAAFDRGDGPEPEVVRCRDTEDTIASLRAGERADLAHPEVGYAEVLHDLGLIRPFDVSLLPHLARVPPAIVARGRIDGGQYHVPVDWGYVAPLVRTDVVAPRRVSYDLLFDGRYAGRIAWFDTPWMLVIAGYVLGARDPWDMDDEELAEAGGLLADRIGLIRGFWSRSDELAREVAAGDVVVAYAWNDAYLAARRAGSPVAFLPRLEEGAIVWTEGFVLAASTRNFFTAHRYVDAWLAPETARRLTAGTAMGHVTFEVGDGVEAEVRDVLRLDDPAAVTGAGVHLDRNIPRRRVYDEAWTAVKRGEPPISATEPVG